MKPYDTFNEVADLKQFDEQWSSTKAPVGPSYSDIPDGVYDAIIEDAEVGETASTGRPVVRWRLRISGPGAANRFLTKHRVITENTLTFLRDELDKCGLPLDRLSDLPQRINALVGHTVSIDKRTKDGSVNIYFRRPEPIPF